MSPVKMAIKTEKKEIDEEKRQVQKERDDEEQNIGCNVKVFLSFLFGLICFSILMFTLLADPILLMLKAYTKVTNGSFVHQLMMKEVEGIHVSAYIFNVTNADRFISGDDVRLKVTEVGPFTYREMRSNVDIDIDEVNQRLVYTPRIRLEFLPEESMAHPEGIKVTVPNIPMLGLASKMSEYAYWTRMGFNLLTNQLDSKPIVNVTASDYLWGYNEPLISLAHSVLPGHIHFDKIGILDRIYDSKTRNRIEVSIKDEEKFMIKKINGHKRLKMGDSIDPDSCTICNTFENSYEGVGYPLEFSQDFPIRIFKNGLCRIIDLELHKTALSNYGAEVSIYHFSDSFYTLDPNTTSSGVLPLPDCFLGIPLAFSKAHFLDADRLLYERIEGIKPDHDKHKGWITIDRRLGLQLETVFSLQLNLVINDVTSNHEAKSFSNMVLPICYIKIVQPPLPDESKFFLNGVYYTGPYIILAVQLFMLILTILFWAYFVKNIYRNLLEKTSTIMSFQIAPVLKEINTKTVDEPIMAVGLYKKSDEFSQKL